MRLGLVFFGPCPDYLANVRKMQEQNAPEQRWNCVLSTTDRFDGVMIVPRPVHPGGGLRNNALFDLGSAAIRCAHTRWGLPARSSPRAASRVAASLALFFEPLLQPWGTPLESYITTQPNAGDAVIFRRALTGVIPNPRFRHSPAGREFCRVDQLRGIIPARSGHLRDICCFCVMVSIA